MNNSSSCINNRSVKERIIAALQEMMEFSDSSSICISDLCRSAGVSRMAFYRNFDSIENVIQEVLNRIILSYDQDNHNTFAVGTYYDELHVRHYCTYLFRHFSVLNGLARFGYGSIYLKLLTEYVIKKWSGAANEYTLIAFAGSLFSLFQITISEGLPPDFQPFIDSIVSIYEQAGSY